MVQAPKDELCVPEKTKKIMRELGGDKVNYTVIDDPEATHEYISMNMGNPEVLKLLRDELESETYDNKLNLATIDDNMLDSAFALTAPSAVVAAITAMSF